MKRIRLFTQLYFDTEPLRASGWPRISRDLATLLDMASVSNVAVNLPEAVLRELKGQFIRELKGHRSNPIFRKIQDLSARVELPDAVKWAITDESVVREFESKTVAALADKAIRTVALSTRPATEYFDLLIDRQLPFSEDGRGFGDAIILMSIIDDLRSRGEEGVLVTADRHFASVRQTATRFGVSLEALTVDGVRQSLLSRLADAALAKYERSLAALRQLLSNEEARTMDFVKNNLEVTDDSLGLLGTLTRSIQSLDRLDAVRIGRVSTTPQLWKLEQPNTEIAVTISGQAVLTATVSRWPTRPPRIYRVGEGSREVNTLEGPVITEETLERPVLINARARWVRDSVFDQLTIEGVATHRPSPAVAALETLMDESDPADA